MSSLPKTCLLPPKRKSKSRQKVTSPGHSIVFLLVLCPQHTELHWYVPTFTVESLTLGLHLCLGSLWKHFCILLVQALEVLGNIDLSPVVGFHVK